MKVPRTFCQQGRDKLIHTVFIKEENIALLFSVIKISCTYIHVHLLYQMACVLSQYNARSDWLTLVHYLHLQGTRW